MAKRVTAVRFHSQHGTMMTDEIEQAREAVASLVKQRDALKAENAPLNSICESMCQQCIGQGVEPSVFYRQWAETEVGKEMLERSARIAELQKRIDEKQNELSILEETQKRQPIE
jgi:predicted RNase H-like nuclease (RuvC/YqgF family)